MQSNREDELNKFSMGHITRSSQWVHLPSLREAKLLRQISKVKKYVIGGAPNYFIIMNLYMDVFNVIIHLSNAPLLTAFNIYNLYLLFSLF